MTRHSSRNHSPSVTWRLGKLAAEEIRLQHHLSAIYPAQIEFKKDTLTLNEVCKVAEAFMGSARTPNAVAACNGHGSPGEIEQICYRTVSCLISSHLINHASPILSNELSKTSVWLCYGTAPQPLILSL